MKNYINSADETDMCQNSTRMIFNYFFIHGQLLITETDY